jgi:hypothetical protein
MTCYLDDDLDSDQLIQLATVRAHRLISPRSVGNTGIHDALHFLFAVSQGHPILTRNAGDFRALHRFALGVGGSHPGLIIVYEEADRRKNMRPDDIVAAIGNLEAAAAQLSDQLVALNNYR